MCNLQERHGYHNLRDWFRGKVELTEIRNTNRFFRKSTNHLVLSVTTVWRLSNDNDAPRFLM